MLNDKFSLLQCLLMIELLFYYTCISHGFIIENKTYSNQNKSWNLSPIMDYDEWIPLGLGDPLKNDPTFDYLPPVLDHVQYWLDSYNMETSTKHDILALGITANKTDLKRSHQIIKFIDESNFNRKEENSVKHDFTDSIGADFPKIIGATNFHKNIISQNQNKIQPFNYVLNQYYNYKSRPFRILLPPYNSLKPKNNSIRNNIYSSLNGKFNFFELPLQISTQTGKGPKIDKMQQYNITEKVYLKDYSDAKIQSKLFSKLKWPIILSEIEDRENYTQDFKQKYKTTTITFQKSNLIYQSTQKSLRSLLNTSTSPTLLSLKKIIKSYNESNDQEFFEINTPIFYSSSDAVTENSNINVQRNKNSNDHIKSQQKMYNIYKPKIISINVNTSDKTYCFNCSSTPTYLFTTSFFSTSDFKKMQVMVTNSSTNSLNHKKYIKGAISIVMPMNYNNQRENFNVVKNLNNSDNVFTSINTKENSMQIAKPLFENFTSVSTTITSPLKNDSFPSLFFNQFSTPYSNSALYSIKTSADQGNVTNPTTVYLVKNISSRYLEQEISTQTFIQDNASLRINPINFSLNNVKIPQNVTRFHQKESLKFHPFIKNILNISISPSIIKFKSNPIENIDKHHENSHFKSVFLLPPIKYESSISSPININMYDRKIKIQSVLPQVIKNNHIKKGYTSAVMTTILPPTKITITSRVTTDSIFSHYKQPDKPFKGPMYIIIEGHSKVKTYKPIVNERVIPMRNNKQINNITQKDALIGNKFKAIMEDNSVQTNNIRIRNRHKKKYF